MRFGAAVILIVLFSAFWAPAAWGKSPGRVAPPYVTKAEVSKTKALRARALGLRSDLCVVRDCLGWSRPAPVKALPSSPYRRRWGQARTEYRQLLRQLAESIRRGQKRIEERPVLLGRLMAAEYGWTGYQWRALYELWRLESGWRVTADNPTSSAYGIPQALPGSKMGPGWEHSARVQIRWGLRYIAGRYGTPTNALAHLKGCGWY